MQPSIGMNSDYNYIFYDFEVKKFSTNKKSGNRRHRFPQTKLFILKQLLAMIECNRHTKHNIEFCRAQRYSLFRILKRNIVRAKEEVEALRTEVD